MPIPAFTIALAATLLVTPIPARANASVDEADLKRLSVEWMQALESKDTTALESVLANDFVLQMPGDRVSDFVARGDWLQNATGRDWSRFRYENLRVHLSGDHADVTSRLYFHVSPIPIELDSGVVDRWERRDGRWQVSRRYLGQSNAGDRIKLSVGFVAALLLAAVAFAVARLIGRRRRRAT